MIVSTPPITIRKAGATKLRGDVTLSEGANITLTQSGNNIAIAAASGTASSTVATDPIWDAKGDLAVGTGADAAVKVTVGSNGQVVIADSGETAGLRYVSTLIDGWIDPDDSWAYDSASTITVPSGAASKYAVGDRIKWTQTTVKYGVIVAVADTVLTIMVNTDYVVANAAISANFYSHDASPVGWPDWFALAAPTFVVGNFDNASGGQPTTTEHRISIVGRKATVHWRGSGTKATTNTVINWAKSSYPTIANSSTGSTYGTMWIFNATLDANTAGIIGDQDSTNFMTATYAAILDNNTLDRVGFKIEFEI